MATLASWTTGTLPTVVGTGVTAVTNGGPQTGVDAIQFAQTPGNASTVQFTFASHTTVAIRSYLELPASWASASSRLMAGRVDGTNLAAAFNLAGSGAAGQVRLVNNGGATTVASSANGTVANSTWYRVELLINNATNQARLGVFALLSDTALYDSGWITNTFGAATTRADVGPNLTSVVVPTMRAADILVTDSVAAWIGRAAWDVAANTPPTCSLVASETVNVEPGRTITLTASTTDSDGTSSITSITQLTGTTVTLVGSGNTRTFIAPATLTGTTPTFRATATDDDGATTTADVGVAVLPASWRIGGVTPAIIVLGG